MRAALWAYLYSRRWSLVLTAVCYGLILALYGLYYWELAPAFYTLIVLSLVLGAAALLDFRTFRRRWETLRHLEQLADRYAGPLPAYREPLLSQALALTAAVERRRQRELAAARKSAERARLYYTHWSHQVKTPMAAMALLLRDRTPDVGDMERELLKMEQYVDMALQYQRLEATENDLSFRRCDAGELVRRTVRRVSPLFIGKQVQLALGALHRTVLTDEKWLCFVLEQVLTNAVKYTPPGGVVRLDFESKATLVISDTGCGIPPEELPRVFEWGYTGTAGRMEQRATGIGLALCRRTMEMLGHRISIESSTKTGTRVLLDLSRTAPAME